MQYFVFVLGIVLAIVGITVSKKIKKHKDKYYMAAFISLIIAVCLEVFTFNYSSFELTGDECTKAVYDVDIADSINQNSSSENITVSVNEGTDEKEYIVTIENIESVVNNLDIIPTSTDETVEYDIYYADDAKSELSKIDSERLVIVDGVKSTNHIKTEFAGTLHSLQINLYTESKTSITNLKIKQNYVKEFNYNGIRVIVVWFTIFALMTISMTWRKKFTKSVAGGARKKVIIGFIVLQCIFVTCLTAVRYEGGGILLNRNSMSSMDPYQELTVALASGKVDLNGLYPGDEEEEKESIEELESLDNAYEWSQRSNITYKWDRALYNGKYYCYYGIVPALLTYLPCYLITGMLLNTVVLTWAFVILCIILMCVFVYNIAQRWKGKLSLWLVVGAMAMFVNCSMLLFCIGGSKFYEIASLSALACVLGGINLIYTAFTKKKIKKANLIMGAFFMALSVGCRPNFLLGSVVAVPLVCNGLYNYKRNSVNYDKSRLMSRVADYIKNIFTKEKIKYIVMFAIPYIIVGCGLMYYNYIRFDSIFEFGSKYQLTVYDTKYYSLTDFAKLPVAIYMCFLMLPGLSSRFPFVNGIITKSSYVGYYYKIASVGMLTYPCMWLAFAAPVSIKRGIKVQNQRGFVVACLFTGLLMCYLTTAVGGVSARYSMDFAWLICIVVIFVVFELYDMSVKHNIEKGLLTILLLLIAISVVINMLLCFSPAFSNINEKYPEIFYGLERTILFWR